MAWTNQYGKSRVFYTSLGHEDDFKLPAFNRMLVNALYWAAAAKLPPANDRSKSASRATSSRKTSPATKTWPG